MRLAAFAGVLALGLWGLPWMLGRVFGMLGRSAPIQDSRTWFWWIEVPLGTVRLGLVLIAVWMAGGVVLRTEWMRRGIRKKLLTVSAADRGRLGRTQTAAHLVVLLAVAAAGVLGAEWLLGLRAESSERRADVAGLAIADVEAASRDHDVRVRRAAIVELGSRGLPADLSLFVEALDDPELLVRQAAVGAFMRLGTVPPEAVPGLARLLDDETSRHGVIWCLMAAGKPGVRSTVEALAHPDPDVRRRATVALHGTWRGVQPGVPEALVTVIKNGPPPQRRAALWFVTSMGNPSPAVVAAAEAALEDPEPAIRFAAACAVIEATDMIDPPAPPIVRARAAIAGDLGDDLLRLAGDDLAHRSTAIYMLSRLGLPKARVVEALTRTLDLDPELARHAAEALGRLGAGAAPAVPALIEALNRDPAELRYAAATALRWIGPKAAAAAPVLSRLAQGLPALEGGPVRPDRQLRVHAIEALPAVAERAAVDGMLRKLLIEPSFAIRRAAQDALARMNR